MPKIFLCHDSRSKREAVDFKDLLVKDERGIEVFLSSDWESIKAGATWFGAILASLRDCDHFIAMIAKTEEARNLWLHFEVGFFMGRYCDNRPKIFVFGGVELRQIPPPLQAIHLIDTGDTNRWVTELEGMGVAKVREKIDLLA